MRVTRFRHVSVNTNGSPLEAMVAFYRDVLGLADLERPDIPGVEGHWHAVGDQQLHLVDAPLAGGGIEPTGHHYCVGVDDIEAAMAELDARQVPYVTAVQDPGVLQVWCCDPAGNTIELQEDPAGR